MSRREYLPFGRPNFSDQEIAAVKLSTQGIKIDTLTPEQVVYMEDYSAGT